MELSRKFLGVFFIWKRFSSFGAVMAMGPKELLLEDPSSSLCKEVVARPTEEFFQDGLSKIEELTTADVIKREESDHRIQRIIAKQDHVLGMVRQVNKSERKEKIMSRGELKSFAAEWAGFLQMIQSHSIEVSEELRGLNWKNRPGFEHLNSDPETQKDRPDMAAIARQATNSLERVANIMELVFDERWETAKNMMREAKLAHHDVFDTQMSWIRLGHYISFDSGYPAYRAAKLNFYRGVIRQELHLIELGVYDDTPAKGEEILDIIEVFKHVSDIERKLVWGMRNSEVSATRGMDLKSYEVERHTQEESVRTLAEHLTSGSLLQRDAIRNFLSGNFKNAHRLADRAYLEMLEADVVHEENLDRGYKDGSALTDPLYRELSRNIQVEIMNLYKKDHLEWLYNEKHQFRKIYKLENGIRNWYERHQELCVHLKKAQLKPSSGNQEIEVNFDSPNTKNQEIIAQIFNNELPTIFDGLEAEAIFEFELISEVHQFLKQGNFAEAWKKLKLATIVQERVFNSKIFHIKHSLSGHSIEETETYQRALKHAREIIDDTPKLRVPTPQHHNYKFRLRRKLDFSRLRNLCSMGIKEKSISQVFWKDLPKSFISLKSFSIEPDVLLRDEFSAMLAENPNKNQKEKLSLKMKEIINLPQINPHSNLRIIDVSEIIERQDKVLGVLKGVSHTRNGYSLSEEPSQSLAKQCREFINLFHDHYVSFSKEFSRLEKRNSPLFPRMKPLMRKLQNDSLINAVMEDTTNSFLWATETINLIIDKRYQEAEQLMIKARLVHRGAYNAQMDMIHWGQYELLNGQDQFYQIAKLEYERASIRKKLFAIDNTPYDNEPLDSEKVWDMMKVFKQFYDSEKKIINGIQNPVLSMDVIGPERSCGEKINKEEAVNNVVRHIIDGLVLQHEVLNKFLAKESKEAHLILNRAYLEMLEAQRVHNDNLAKGYYDRKVIIDPLYYQQSKILREEILKLYDIDHLEWLDNSKKKFWKRDWLKNSMMEWHENHEDLSAQLRYSYEDLFLRKDNGPMNTNSHSYTNKEQNQSNLKERISTVFDGLHLEAIHSVELVLEGYSLLKKGNFKEAWNHLKLAKIIQKKVFKSCLTDVKYNILHEVIESNKIFQTKYQTVREIIKEFQKSRIAISWDRFTSQKFVKAEVHYLFCSMKDVNKIFMKVQWNPEESQTILKELPKLFTVNLDEFQMNSNPEENLKIAIEKACKALKLMNESLENIEQGELDYASSLLKESQQLRLEVDRIRTHRALEGLSDDPIRLDPVYQAEYIKLRERFDYE